MVLAAALIGCGGGDDAATTTPTGTRTAPATAAKKPAGTADRGATRCTRTAILAALLVDVERLPFQVEGVRCRGAFARSRFVARGCAPGQTADGIPCGSARVAVWRRGAKRWRLITYAADLTCADVRKEAADFPRSLCD